MKDFVTEAVEGNTRELLKKARKKSARVIDDSDLSDVFGIDMESPVVPKAKGRKTGRKGTAPKKPSKGTKAKAPMGKSGKRAVSKKTSPETRTPKTLFETVVGVVKKSKKGMTVAMIREKTGLGETQIRNVVSRARRQGIIKNRGRGVYISA